MEKEQNPPKSGLRAAEAETNMLNAIALPLKTMVRSVIVDALVFVEKRDTLSLTSCAAAASLPRSSSTIFVDTVFLV
jgi:hypothetical protein